MPIINIHTDGACIDNPGPGGFAAIIDTGYMVYTISGGEHDTTSNRMEVRAALEPLRALDTMLEAQNTEVVIHSDSVYLTGAFSKGWLDRWRQNGWRTRGKKRVKSHDLWMEMIGAVRGRNVSFKWIKGHDGHTMNERCDSLANIQARRAVRITEPFITSDVPQTDVGVSERTPTRESPPLMDW